MSGADLGPALELIYAQMNRSAASPPQPVFVTEWGVPLNQAPHSLAVQTLHNVLAVSASKPFVSRTIFWQLINNELLSGGGLDGPGGMFGGGQSRGPNPDCNGKEDRDPSNQRGFWTVLPNGTLSYFG